MSRCTDLLLTKRTKSNTQKFHELVRRLSQLKNQKTEDKHQCKNRKNKILKTIEIANVSLFVYIQNKGIMTLNNPSGRSIGM